MPAHTHYIYDRYPTLSLTSSAHMLSKVTPEILQLDDGSSWKVSLYDQEKTSQWCANDSVSVTQNTRWFSPYPYRVVHRVLGSSVEAALEMPSSSLRLSSTDSSCNTVTLSNGTGWKTSEPIPFTWSSADPILIGDNSSADFLEWEYILINTTKPAEYVQAHQLY